MAKDELPHGDGGCAKEMAHKVIASPEQVIADMLKWLSDNSTPTRQAGLGNGAGLPRCCCRPSPHYLSGGRFVPAASLIRAPARKEHSLDYQIKTDFADILGIPKDTLYIHVGLVSFVSLIVVSRQSPCSFIPWLGALLFEIVNELPDVFDWHAGAVQFKVGNAFQDIVNTMLLPTVAMLVVRIPAARRSTKALTGV